MLQHSLEQAERLIKEHEGFIVENLHFQSLPGLYVTANLYLPKERQGRLPAILYVCGHGRAKENGRSLGNKTYPAGEAAPMAVLA